MTFREQWLLCCLAPLAVGLAGCGEDHPTTVEVTGQVIYNDQPVEGAAVMFQNESGKPATGETDAQGHFSLRTFEADDGARPGDYVVTITKVESVPAAPAGSDPGREPPQPTRNPPKSLLPAKYSDAATSGLKQTVTEAGPNQFTFQLTD